MTGVGSRHRPPSRLEGRSGLSQHSCSFDHLVSAGEKRWRDRQPQRIRGFEVNRKRKAGGLLNGQVSGRSSLEQPGEFSVERCGKAPPDLAHTPADSRRAPSTPTRKLSEAAP